jgi:hypothetical protein
MVERRIYFACLLATFIGRTTGADSIQLFPFVPHSQSLANQVQDASAYPESASTKNQLKKRKSTTHARTSPGKWKVVANWSERQPYQHQEKQQHDRIIYLIH